MEDIMKTVKPFEESGLLIEWISKTDKNEAKKKKGETLGMLLGTLVASLLGSALTGQWVTRANKEQIEQVKLFNAISSFNWFWNKNIWSKSA